MSRIRYRFCFLRSCIVTSLRMYVYNFHFTHKIVVFYSKGLICCFFIHIINSCSKGNEFNHYGTQPDFAPKPKSSPRRLLLYFCNTPSLALHILYSHFLQNEYLTLILRFWIQILNKPNYKYMYISRHAHLLHVTFSHTGFH